MLGNCPLGMHVALREIVLSLILSRIRAGRPPCGSQGGGKGAKGAPFPLAARESPCVQRPTGARTLTQNNPVNPISFVLCVPATLFTTYKRIQGFGCIHQLNSDSCQTILQPSLTNYFLAIVLWCVMLKLYGGVEIFLSLPST